MKLGKYIFEWGLGKVKMCEWENSSCCIKDWRRMMRFRHKHYSISSGWFLNLYWVLLSLKGEGSVHCQMFLSDPLSIPRWKKMFALAYETAKAVNIHFYLLSKLFMSIFPLYAANAWGSEQVRSLDRAINKQGLSHYKRLLHTLWLHLLIKSFWWMVWSLWDTLNSIEHTLMSQRYWAQWPHLMTSHQMMLQFSVMLVA